MKDKIAFVCQRYGLEVNGGAELYCRQLAEKMKQVYDVEVFTTCAVDYTTWANVYKPGAEEINGVLVHRFRSLKMRDRRFPETSGRVLGHPHSDEDETLWLEQQGPYCPELLEVLEEKHHEYRAVIFVTYLYYPTAMGMLLNFENAVLLPTAHDEAPIYLKHFDKVFAAARKIIWLTPEEKSFSEKRFPFIHGVRSVCTGAGVDVPKIVDEDFPDRLAGIDYITYAGRIDESKGCAEMSDYFRRYKQKYGGDLKLVLMGKAVMSIPQDSDIIHLGFVSDEVKFSVIKNAKALVLFSKFESLSMVVLESMTMGRPVLVNGQCEVLKGHCVRSNAGLYFENYYEFAEGLNYLLTHDAEYAVMQENGKKYVQENYQWDVILKRIVGLIEHVEAN